MSGESVTKLRSKILDNIATVLLLVGVLGFFACWGIGWESQQQVLGRTELRDPSLKRTAAIEMKGVTWYVEPGFARRYKTADNLTFVFWLLGAAGGPIQERKRLAAWWRSRHNR